jgi:hypothetical protein
MARIVQSLTQPNAEYDQQIQQSFVRDVDGIVQKLNTSLPAVIVTVIVSAFPESSDTNIDFTIEVVAVGTVYNVVTLVDVKSTFLFINELAKEISLRFCFVF